MENYKIYCLIDPITDKVMYIGQTSKTLSQRLSQHLKSKYNKNKINWINHLLSLDSSPIIILLENCIDKYDADFKEREYIKNYRNNGYDLLNMTSGGQGCYGYKHTDNTKEILSEHRKNLLKDEERIKKAIEAGKNSWNKKTEKEKLNNMLNQKGRKNITQYTLNGKYVKTYKSLRQIERELGYFRANIIPCLKGIFKQAYGFKWKYAK